MSDRTDNSAAATAVRPFAAEIPEAEIEALRARIAATRWPEKETVADASQGVPLAVIQELARYWATGYDWRRCQAQLNALPQFMTEIDGLDIHFIHVRSRHQDALPLIVNHGWPGSVIEQLKIIGPLTDPTAHGGGPGYRTGPRTRAAPGCISSGIISPRCCCAAEWTSSASRNGLATTALRSHSTSTGTSCPTITRPRCGRSRRYSRPPSAQHQTAQRRPSLARKAAESAF